MPGQLCSGVGRRRRAQAPPRRTVVAMTSVRRLVNRAHALDALPYSPSSLGERALDRLARRRRDRAARDSTWAAIEARRNTGGSGKILISDDLTFAELEQQRAIAHRLTPDPWWATIARRCVRTTAAGLVAGVGARIQLAARGWADGDVISLSHTFCERLGAQLCALSAAAHGWPDSEAFPTPESWTGALERHGAALVRYGAGVDDRELSAAIEAWYHLVIDPGADPDAAQAAFEHQSELEEARLADAKAALHFVAEHLESLWD